MHIGWHMSTVFFSLVLIVVAVLLTRGSADPTVVAVDGATSAQRAAILFPPNPPFGEDHSLEPHISAKTVDHHYRAHQGGYVSKLNAWLATATIGETAQRQQATSSVVVSVIRGTPTGSPPNNLASQIYNHALYFAALTSAPSSALATGSKQPAEGTHIHNAIAQQYGSFDKFWTLFKQRAISHFGSGWIWLVANKTTVGSTPSLKIVDTHDAQTPIATDGDNLVPLLVCDVWEHAYYLDHQQRRDAYLESWLRVVNWDFVEQRWDAGRVEFPPFAQGYPSLLPTR